MAETVGEKLTAVTSRRVSISGSTKWTHVRKTYSGVFRNSST